MKKLRVNYRVVVLIAILAAIGVQLIWVEKLPAYLRPGLHLNAYVANAADGTISAIDLVRLAPIATISVGSEPSGLRAHPTRPEIWGV
ncbi:MAG: hypothetical protein WB995_10300, partial [Candidatus Acidiferrales bacterium]